VAAPSSRAELVEKLRSSIEAHETHVADPAIFRDFVLASLRSVDVSFFGRQTAEEALRTLEEMLRFIEGRRADEIRVRLIPGDPAVLETCMRDQPFLYDTLRLLLDDERVEVEGGFHAVVPIARAEDGHITGVGVRGMPLESVIHLELSGVDGADRAQALAVAVRDRLAYARGAVRAFPRMVVAVEEIMNRYDALARERPEEREALLQARGFLGWLLDHHFIFMGMGYVPHGSAEAPGYAAGLGTHALEPPPPESIDRNLAAAEPRAPYLRVRKSLARSRIHRAGRLDHVLARWFDARGVPGGLVVVEGLFTYRALSKPAAEIPMLAPMLQRILEEAGLPPDSYRARTLRYAFSVLPVEFLFMAPFEEVSQVVDRILAAAETRSTQVTYSIDAARESAYLFVAVPKAEYDDELRAAIEDLLPRRFGAAAADHGVSLGVLETAVLHFFLSGKEIRTPDLEGLREEVHQLVAPWRERLRHALRRRYPDDEDRVERLLARYDEAFPEEYRRTVPPARTVEDIEHIEALAAGKPMSFDLFREEIGGQLGDPLLRIYEREDVLLSDLLPVLDHFGLLVSSQYETKVYMPGGPVFSMDTFRLGGVRGVPGADLLAARPRLLEALEAVFAGRFTDSPLNALLLRAEITWRDVGLFRSYLAYARQLGFRFAPGLVQEVLLRNAETVRVLAGLFRTKFDPRFPGDAEARAAALEKCRRDFLERLEAVTDYAADRILRSLLNLIDATVRTNLYCRDERTDNLALKFDCKAVELMTAPRPEFEIFVHHASVQGVHLRGGKIARGGIRWSDRVDDYRTEILGLMRTQMVKNAIIVPVGAKGGFVLNRPAENPAERRAQADAAYRLFIGALLDVTDNLRDGKVERPAEVVCYDDEDPYLVVAADKGTAHLSDVANEIAQARGFWLADAFASGGSHGYDHKATGITARGVWVCARRHLREIGIDPDQNPITVVGIGDMSGDVFGNGLLCSRNFKLVAAFDHRHIFIDPDPDPVASYEERLRLFRLPGSSWADVDPKVLSPGGGVWRRDAKEIRLSPELKQRLGVNCEALSGEEMIRTLLTLDVDLIWNGGIGTYIKASTEDHRDVGDRANDPVRVDAKDVRARVIAEGGNLGVTQAGRVEFAARGGRINTDAIDNSGGVDLSDHEVNLKILFEPSCRAGTLSAEARNRLLEQVQKDVVHSVLKNNSSQSRLLSLDERRSRREVLRFSRTIRFLARAVPFDARALRLPDERTLRARAQEGQGVLRPELALLAGYCKIYVTRMLHEEGQLDPRSPRLWPMLLGYFPKPIAESYKREIAAHLLAREIGIAVLTNRIVDDGGVTFVPELQEWSGRSCSEVAAAYLAASEASDAWSVKADLERLEGILPLEAVYKALLRIEDGLEQGAALLLSGLGGGTLECPPGAREILSNLRMALPPETAMRHDAACAEIQATGLPEAVARQVASFDLVVLALLGASCAEAAGRPPLETFAAFFAAGEASRILELERRLGGIAAEAHAEAGALRTLRYRFLSHLARLVVAPPGTAASRVGQVGAEVGRALERDLTIPSLVTLEDRVQRLASA
jgi:glutamate dehydrogenase